jgi:chorismate-pyruvate lyase
MREIRYVDAKVDIHRSRLPQRFRDESKMGKKSIGSLLKASSQCNSKPVCPQKSFVSQDVSRHACFEDICRALVR